MAGSYVPPGSVENPTPGQFATAAWGDAVNAALNYFDTLVDDAAWTNWTPQVDQGASINIAKTITYARYKKIGRVVIAEWSLAMTAAGSAAAEIRVSIPHNPPAGTGDTPTGQGMFIDASAGQVYTGTCYVNGANKVPILQNAAGGNGIGFSPNIAIASGDSVRGSVIYESAA